jgi:hypothetical protein
MIIIIMDKISNIHLRKIIQNYISFQLPFKRELLNKTECILQDTEHAIFYENRYTNISWSFDGKSKYHYNDHYNDWEII